jgi:hypothetical protein
LKRTLLVWSLVLGLGLACTGGPEVTPEPVPEEPEPTDTIVVVPVEDDGKQHFCCEYTEGDETRFALLPGARACATRFGDKGGRWVEGPQCLPCCCQTQLSPTDPSQGHRHELTVPSACAGVGQCVSSDVPECEPDEPDRPAKRPPQRPPPGRPPVRQPPEPEPDRDREVIEPKDPNRHDDPAPKPSPGDGGKAKRPRD